MKRLLCKQKDVCSVGFPNLGVVSGSCPSTVEEDTGIFLGLAGQPAYLNH